MKKILLFLSILSIWSCRELDFADWEIRIKYNLICGTDTIRLSDVDTISCHNSFVPTITILSDSSMIVVGFMNNKGVSPSIKQTVNTPTTRKNTIKYQCLIPTLNSKLELIEFNRKLIRYKKVSEFDESEL